MEKQYCAMRANEKGNGGPQCFQRALFSSPNNPIKVQTQFSNEIVFSSILHLLDRQLRFESKGMIGNEVSPCSLIPAQFLGNLPSCVPFLVQQVDGSNEAILWI